jgi:tripartite-type tricarboxylate transporter receptor subunit TctC
MKKLMILLGLCIASCVSSFALAQSWPDKTVKVIVPYAPGGGVDPVARLVSQKLADIWKQSVVVENKAGGSGTIGANFVAHAPSDGLTILPHIQSGALKALGLSSKVTSMAAPNIPPLAKTPGLQNFDLTQWFGVYVPSGTPNAIAQKIQKDIVDVLRMPDVKETLEKQGAQPGNMTMAEFQSFSNAESKKFAAIVKTAKIEP